MNLWYQHVPNAVTRTVGRSILQTSKHSPTLLFAGGVIGVVATAVMASRATLQVEETLAEHKETLEKAKSFVQTDPKYSEEDLKRDTVILYSRMAVDVAKLYGPTLIVGGLSIAALTRSHVILTRRNAAITAAYVALEKGFAEYRRRVVQEFGEETDRRLRHSDEVAWRKAEDGTIQVQKHTDPNDYSIYARFFDQNSRKYQGDADYNFMFLRAQQNFANDLLKARGHIFLNDVYDMIGVPRSRAGAVVGWILSDRGDNYVDFGLFDSNRESARSFVNGDERAILLDFNVDGLIYDKI